MARASAAYLRTHTADLESLERGIESQAISRRALLEAPALMFRARWLVNAVPYVKMQVSTCQHVNMSHALSVAAQPMGDSLPSRMGEYCELWLVLAGPQSWYTIGTLVTCQSRFRAQQANHHVPC